jgi:hypothetical protein
MFKYLSGTKHRDNSWLHTAYLLQAIQGISWLVIQKNIHYEHKKKKFQPNHYVSKIGEHGKPLLKYQK